MRRSVLAAAVATLAVLVMAPAPAAARTAAPDPVRALKKQLKAERGVKLTELVQTGSTKVTPSRRSKGGVQLSPSGPVASYVFTRDVGEDAGTSEFLGVDRRLYVRDEETVLPPGKKWVNLQVGKISHPLLPTIATEQPINVFDPVVLKTILKGERPKRVPGGYRYEGAVTYRELYEAAKTYYSFAFKDLAYTDWGRRKITYRLWTDGTGLIQRLRTSGTLNITTVVDTRYTDWGHLLVIEPPAEDEVVTYDVLDKIEISEPGLPVEGLTGLR